VLRTQGWEVRILLVAPCKNTFSAGHESDSLAGTNVFLYGACRQAVKTSDCDSDMRGFESHHAPQVKLNDLCKTH